MGVKKTEVFRDELTVMAKAALDANEEAAAKAAKEIEDTPLPDLGEDEDLPIEIIPGPPVKKEEPLPREPVKQGKDWKAEHDKMFGTLSNTIAELRRELAASKGTSAELDTLRKEIAELRAAKTAEPAKTAVVDKEVVQKFATAFGVGDDEMTELIQHITPKDTSDTIAALRAEVDALRGGVTKTAQQAYDDKLISQMPDAYAIGESPEFGQWLKDNDWFESFVTAHQSHNVAKVLDKLKKYKAATAPPVDAEAEAEEAERQRLIKEQAAGPGKGSGPKPSAAEMKILTGAAATVFKQAYIARDQKYWPDGPGGKPSPKAKAMFEKLTGQV